MAKFQNDAAPSVLLTMNATCSVIVTPGRSWFAFRDYSSIVFGEAPQTQLPPSIPSTSDIIVKIFDEDQLEEDPDKTTTPADFDGDEDALPTSASPVLRESLGGLTVSWDRLPLLAAVSPTFSDCPSLTSEHTFSDVSSKLI
jgi:hypothetical protein